jgi:hypothetical protein
LRLQREIFLTPEAQSRKELNLDSEMPEVLDALSAPFVKTIDTPPIQAYLPAIRVNRLQDLW